MDIEAPVNSPSRLENIEFSEPFGRHGRNVTFNLRDADNLKSATLVYSDGITSPEHFPFSGNTTVESITSSLVADGGSITVIAVDGNNVSRNVGVIDF